MQYPVYVRRVGARYLAHVPAVLGVVAAAAEEDRAVQAAIADARRVHSQRASRGEPVSPGLLEAGWSVRRVEGGGLPEDRQPVGVREVPALLRWMDRARQELLRRRPSGEQMVHLAESEWWYLSRLRSWPTDPLDRLEAIQAWGLARLERLPPTSRTRVSRHGGEEWTARKALRVMLESQEELRSDLAATLDEPASASTLRVGGVADDVLYLQEGSDGRLSVYPAAEVGRRVEVAHRTAVLDDLPDRPWTILEFPPGALLATDRLPLTSGQLAGYRTALERGRRTICALVGVRGADGWAGRLVEACALRQWDALRACLVDWPEEPLERLRTVRSFVAGRLAGLTTDDLRTVNLFLGEIWTARRVFRRCLEHDREHAPGG